MLVPNSDTLAPSVVNNVCTLRVLVFESKDLN